MQHYELIGYARIDSEADRDILNEWANRLRACGATEIITDVGPLPSALAGLRNAIGRLKINDALIYPEVCLRELTVGDIPSVFGDIPDGTALKFFQPIAATALERGEDLTSITLVEPDVEDADI